MLATDIAEHLRTVRYGKGFMPRLESAAKFVLDPQASAMAASVSLSKPSSILDAIGFARLPAEPTWIEFANSDVRKAMGDMGSPLKQVKDAPVTIERSGFLLASEGESLKVEYVHRDRMHDGTVVTDIAPVVCSFSLKGYDLLQRELMAAIAGQAAAEKIAKGRVQKHLDQIAADPREAAADAELRQRLKFSPQPEVAPMREFIVRHKGEAAARSIEAAQESEFLRLFLLQALPTLILIACRNAVDLERVPAPVRLNAQRAKKGRPAIHEHSIVKMHLSPARKRLYEALGGTASATRGGTVMGHFKVRKSGVYWWSPHWRGGRLAETRDRVVVLTR